MMATMTPEQLRAIVKDAEAWNGKIMSEWDAVRAALRNGQPSADSDLPRLMFETNILEPLLEAIGAGADEIEQLRAGINQLRQWRWSLPREAQTVLDALTNEQFRQGDER